ncbi:CidA/LrgA family protein [Membranihabitans marinus]|uniref:CidA/LrgA family protein n=1 Tax=Membranihabitans marinus TaxID=1227546 RepID=UPI001F00B1DA|nr:CidA/LrgA family protein [Membranihabitans marinus]
MKNKLIPLIQTGFILVRGFGIIVLLFFLGEFLAPFIPFPIPGSIIGMILLFTALKLNIIPLSWVDHASTLLLSFLALFFVPYGVGIMDSYQAIEQWSLPIVAIAIGTTILSLLIVGHLFTRFKNIINRFQ